MPFLEGEEWILNEADGVGARSTWMLKLFSLWALFSVTELQAVG